MKHPTLLVFLASTLAVFGALAWVTRHALSLERQQRQARIDAQVQERVRLALWRMDSKANALIARESARPYFEYQPFYPAERAYTRMLEEVRVGEVLVPSPLLTLRDRYVKLFFQVDALGIVTSPQAPTGNLRDLAEATYVSPAHVINAGDRLENVSQWVQDRATSTEVGGDASAPQAMPAPLESAKGVRADDGPARQEQGVANVPGSDVPAPPQPKAGSAVQSQSKAGEAQSLAEYRARISSTESAKETAQVENRAPAKQTARGALPPSSAGAGAREEQQEARLAAEDAKKTQEKTPQAQTAGQTTADRALLDKHSTKDQQEDHEGTTGASGAKSEHAGTPAPSTPDGRPGSPTPTSGDRADKDATIQPVSTPPPPSPIGAPVTPLAADLEAKLKALSQDASRLSVGTDPLAFGFAGLSSDEAAVEVGSFSARWAGATGIRHTQKPELLFVREVDLGTSSVRQGFWVDWEVLRNDLLEGVRDLLPEATLTPVIADATSEANVDVLGRRLASFPAELEPGPDCAASIGAGVYGWSPLRNTLILAWAGVLIAIAAIAFLLRAATDLAERRGRFVSAVTHELRTPLTTFVMYSQMLADGMVPEGEARQHYYGTLKREASRLAGIVENVLEFARLSRAKRARKAPVSGGTVRAGDLVERLAIPLRQRVEQAGAALDITVDEAAKNEAVSTDELTLERVLFNLVDNACKYGKGPGGVVRVHVSVEGASIVFTVSDDGPGINAEDRPRIFKAFERGGKQADGSIPGLGLGLALSRGLAKDLGGDLTLAAAVPATFVLRVPK